MTFGSVGFDRFYRKYMHFFRQLLVCLSLLLVLVSQAGPSDTLKIVFFGDSITSLWPTVDSVFAQRVPTLLAHRGIACESVIAGTGSSHSGTLADNDFAKVKHGLERFQSEVLDQHPDLVVIGFGTNDAYIDGDDPDGNSRIPLKKFEANLCTMITELQSRGVDVILRTPPPFAFPEARMYQDRRLATYVRVVRRLAKRYRTGLADNYRSFQEYGRLNGGYAQLLPDGVHPNDEGHTLIAETVVDAVLKMTNRNHIK